MLVFGGVDCRLDFQAKLLKMNSCGGSAWKNCQFCPVFYTGKLKWQWTTTSMDHEWRCISYEQNTFWFSMDRPCSFTGGCTYKSLPAAQFKSIHHSSPPSYSLRSSARTSQHDFWANQSILGAICQSSHLPPRDHSQPFQLSKAPTSQSSFHSSQPSSRPWPSQVLWFRWVPGWKIRGGQYSVEKTHKQTSKQQIRVDSI